MSVTVRLADDLDVSRGDLICRPANAPQVTQDLDAMVCWMADEPLRPRQRLRSSTPPARCAPMVKDLQYRLDVNTLHRDEAAAELGLNDIGRVRLRTTQPLFVDDYAPQPGHRRVHPHRRGDQRHRRRRDAHPRH